MSFLTNNPNGTGEFQSGNAHAPRRPIIVPAFRPEFVRSVKMHPLLTAVVAAITFVALVIFALLIKPVYQAEALVQEEPGAAKLIGDTSGGSFDAVRYDSFLQQQTQIILRPDIIANALQTLPQATWQEYGPSATVAAGNIAGQLKVARVTTSYQLAVDLKGSDPVKTAAIVNAITDGYLAEASKATRNESDQRAVLLQEERGRVENELQTARAEQTALGISLGVANPTGETGNPFDANLAAVRAELVEARAAHDAAAAKLSSLTGQGNGRNSALTAAADELIAGDAGLSSMKATISQRRATLVGQMAGMTPSNPVYKQDQDEIADLDRKLDDTTVELRDKAERQLQDKLRGELERTGDIEARLNASLARQTVAATGAAPRLQRASELAADILRLETRHAAVEDALHSLQLEASGPAVAHLFLAATPPAAPERSRRRLILLAALPLALLLGAFAAAFVRKRDRRIYTGQDVEDTLGFPAIALLPARADVSDRVLDEHVLRLAGGIESAYRSGGARTFVLTAVSLHTDIGPLAARLQRKFEQMGMDVVLASTTDLMRPPQPSDSGDPVHNESAELLAAGYAKGGFVGANLDRIQANHSLVLIEAAPLVNSAETEYVARSSNATILIVESAVTTRDEVMRAAGLLQRLSVNGIGAVLEELQLRYADAPYKEAIEVLEHRHTSPGASRQTVIATARTEAAAVDVVHRTPAPIEAVAPGVPFVEEVAAHEVVAAQEVPVAAAPIAAVHTEEASLEEVSTPEIEMPGAEIEAVEAHMPEPRVAEQPPVQVHASQLQVPAVHVPAVPEVEEISPEPVAQPAEIPAAALEDAVTEAVPLVLITRVAGETDAASIEAAEPEFEQAHTPPPMSETAPHVPAQEPTRMQSADALPHEKMASKLRASTSHGTPFGDAGMTPSRSWWQRLLRRDQEPAYSIIPDDDDADAVETHSSNGAGIVRLPERRGYDIPPERFDQISRSRPAARPQGEVLKPHVPTRFTLEPEEPAVPAHTALHLVADQTPPSHGRDESRYPKAVDPALFEDEAGLHTPVVPEPVSPVPTGADAIPGEGVGHETVGHEAVEQEQVHSEPLLQAVNQVDAAGDDAAPAVDPDLYVAPDHAESTAVVNAPVLVPAPPRPLSFHELTALLAEHAPILQETNAVTAPEEHIASLQPSDQLSPIESQADSFPAPAQEQHIEPEAEPEPVAAAAPEPEPAVAPAHRDPLPISSADQYHRPSNPNLNRWDPIPPLRPTEGDWRDRISSSSHRVAAGSPWAIHTESSTGSRHASGQRDAWSRPSQPDPREREVSLTRQWGLLSRFQQASGLASGSRRVAETEATEEGRSEQMKNGSTNGSR